MWESWWRKTVIGRSGTSAPQAEHFQVFLLGHIANLAMTSPAFHRL